MNNKSILVIGTMHAAQDVNHLKKRLAGLRKKFSPAFVKNEETNLIKMREEILQLVEQFRPDIVLEECGPYQVVPGDTWKAQSGSDHTILEKLYSGKHKFVDAKLLASGEKPSAEEKEREIVKLTQQAVKESGVSRVVLVVGASHLDHIVDLIKVNDWDIQHHNLKNKFFGNIKELLEREKL